MSVFGTRKPIANVAGPREHFIEHAAFARGDPQTDCQYEEYVGCDTCPRWLQNV